MKHPHPSLTLTSDTSYSLKPKRKTRYRTVNSSGSAFNRENNQNVNIRRSISARHHSPIFGSVRGVNASEYSVNADNNEKEDDLGIVEMV